VGLAGFQRQGPDLVDTSGRAGTVNGVNTPLKDLQVVARRFERLKYDTKVVQRTRRATLRVSGQGWDREGVECHHSLVLELEFDGKLWHPLSIDDQDWAAARSWLVTTSGTLVAKRAIVNNASLTWAFEQLARRKPKPITAADLADLG
jgi:hypothetical protein